MRTCIGRQKCRSISGSIERSKYQTSATRTGWLLAFSKPKMPQPADVSQN
jgi:hypothetical protein